MTVSESFMSRNQKSIVKDHVHRHEISIITYNQTKNTPLKLLPGPNSASTNGSSTLEQDRPSSVLSTMNKLVKGKLSLGAKVLLSSRLENVFRRMFSLKDGEQLLKASQCCLFTTGGPIPGRLFISTDKLAFCSDKPIAKYSSPTGESLRFHYKVVIPQRKIMKANLSENTLKSNQKYLQVTTTDDFEFWFTGFLNYKKILKCLQQAAFKC